MCGILGIFNIDAKPVDPSFLQRMTDIMSHRGPDGRGLLLADISSGKTLFFDDVGAQHAAPLTRERSMLHSYMPTIGLGHRRLNILDITSGQQPMSNEDGSVWITFNGEIYNFQELWRELQTRGHRFKTDHSDTETIIHAYEEWDEECLQKLSGMFAFGILDLKRRKLFLARDRAGEKPLYYYYHQGKFIFASEIKAILEDSSVPRDLELTALADYLKFGYIPSPKTIFKHIYKLRPRHYISISIDLNSSSPPLIQKAYWDIQWNPEASVSEAEWCERLRAELTESVKLRMISDVPLGAFLSGGIDSSTIVALMSRLQDRPVKTFSIGFEEEEYNELPYARQIANKYHTEHHEKVVKPNAIEILPKLAWQYDEPFADSSAIPMYYVSQMARKDVTVALSGDAGDELFAGYTLYDYALKYHKFDLIPHLIRQIVFGALARLIPDQVKGKRAATLLSMTKQNRYQQMLTLGGSMGLMGWKKLLRHEVKADLELEDDFNFHEHWKRVETHDFLTQMQYVDLNVYLPEDILVKVDRASMLNSLEVRVPLLEHKIIELAAQIPSRLKMNGKDKKYIIKRMMLEELGKDFLYRPKTGFAIPLERWFRSDLKAYSQELLLDPKSFIASYIEPHMIQKMLKDHQTGKRNFSSIIWALLFLEQWGRIYK